MNEAARNLAVITLLLASGPAWADEPDWDSMAYTPHAEFQAVDADGFGTFPLQEPVKMKGIWLNPPEEMLDGTPGAPNFLGGLWQVFVQTAEEDDFGGTACWMGQYIGKLMGNHPEGSYTDEEWLEEIYRLSHDPITDHEFEPGDLVEVRARAPGLHFRGKTNINEQHSNNPEADFDIYLLEAGCGLPRPTVITLADVKDEDDEFIFDPARLVGAERYQATLVRINDVEFESTEDWGPDAELTIMDGTGRTFTVKLGLGDGFSLYDPPPPPFDVVAIFDQEDENPDDGLTDGYRLWVMNYDGNGRVLGYPYRFNDARLGGPLEPQDIQPVEWP